MTPPKTTRYFTLLILLFLAATVGAQKQEQMEQLNYLVGEWIGTTTIYKNGEVLKQGAAFEKIAYDLDRSILVIELNTEFLQLRTIINYHEEDGKYYYHRFAKDGAARYPAEFKDGQLIVWKDDKTRFFFGTTPAGGFREYGEQLVDGKWVMTFEDIFINTL